MQDPINRIAVAYARISGIKQDKELSHDSQFDEIKRYAASIPIPIKKFFGDVGSGLSIKSRPQFRILRDYVLDPRNGITDVIFTELSRFARNKSDLAQYMEEMLKAGINLHSAALWKEFGPGDELLIGMMALVNEEQSRTTGYHTKRTQRTAVEHGYYLAGRVPWGYLHDEIEVGGRTHPTLKPDPELWPHVLDLWQMSIDGAAASEIAKHFNQKGVPSPEGDPWKRSTVLYIQKSETYKGVTFRGKNQKSRLPGWKVTLPVVYGENAHEAAVTPETWDKVQENIAGRTKERGPTRSHSSDNLLSGYLKCGLCWSSDRDKNMVLRPGSLNIRYLMCTYKKRYGKEYCDKKNHRLDVVENKILSYLMNKILTREVLEHQVHETAKSWERYLKEDETLTTSLKRQIDQKGNEIGNITNALKLSGADLENLPTLIGTLQEWELEKAELGLKLEANQKELEHGRLFVTDREEIIETALTMKTYTETSKKYAVKEIIKLFIERIEVFDKYADIYYALPAVSKESQEGNRRERIIFKEPVKEPVKESDCVLLEGCMDMSPWPPSWVSRSGTWPTPTALGASDQVHAKPGLDLLPCLGEAPDPVHRSIPWPAQYPATGQQMEGTVIRATGRRMTCKSPIGPNEPGRNLEWSARMGVGARH